MISQAYELTAWSRTHYAVSETTGESLTTYGSNDKWVVGSGDDTDYVGGISLYTHRIMPNNIRKKCVKNCALRRRWN